jgi:hypothetical protein
MSHEITAWAPFKAAILLDKAPEPSEVLRAEKPRLEALTADVT